MTPAPGGLRSNVDTNTLVSGPGYFHVANL